MVIVGRHGLPVAVHVASTRWERHVDTHRGMVQLTCAGILLRAFMR
jgi:hypothetical protein